MSVNTVPVLAVASLFSLTSLTMGACKRDSDPAEAAKPDRKTRCNAIGDQVTQMGMALAQGLAVGLSDGKAKIDGDEESKLRAELETAKAELVEQCMDWPEEALDCFGVSALTMSAKCERILAAAMGDAVLPDDVPAGPAPAWTHELPHELTDLLGRSDGSVVALVEPKDAEGDEAAFVIGVANGNESWRRALPSAPFALEAVAGGPVIAVADRAVYGVDPADGRLGWTAESPTNGDEGRVELLAIARRGNDLFVLDDEHRIAKIDAGQCAIGKACLQTVATAEMEDTYATQWLVDGPGGGWIIVAADDGLMHVFDGAGKDRFALASRVAVSWARTRDDALHVGIDGAVAVLDPARCGADGQVIAPIAWPPGKKAKWAKDATVREIEVTPTPEGCVRWQAELGVAEDSDPVDVAGDGMWAQSGGFLFGFDATGKQQVRTAVAANSFVVPSGDGLAVVGDMGSESVQLVLTWLSMKGEHRRRSALPLAADKMFILDDVELESAGRTIVAGLERSLVAFAE
jgi:hypothetical protein